MIETALERLDLLEGRPEIPFTAAPDDVLARVHDPRYIAGIREFPSRVAAGWMPIPPSVHAGRRRRARRRGRRRRRRRGARRPRAAWFRPRQDPGHHATFQGHGILPVQYGGSRRRARARSRPGQGADRRLGRPPRQWHTRRLLRDGPSALLLDSPVAALSRHGGRERARRRPRRGIHHERAAPPGANDDAYTEVFDQVFLPAASAFRPQIVLISAGFDAHANDPLGSMQVTERGSAISPAALSGSPRTTRMAASWRSWKAGMTRRRWRRASWRP